MKLTPILRTFLWFMGLIGVTLSLSYVHADNHEEELYDEDYYEFSDQDGEDDEGFEWDEEDEWEDYDEWDNDYEFDLAEEKGYTQEWFDELDEILEEYDVSSELQDQIRAAQGVVLSAESEEDFFEALDALYAMENQVFENIDWGDEWEFDIDEEKMWLSEWMEELSEIINEDELGSEYADQVASLQAELNGITNEDDFHELIDQLIEIEEEMFDYEDDWDDDYFDEIDDLDAGELAEFLDEEKQFINDEIAHLTEFAAEVGVDVSAEVAAATTLVSEMDNISSSEQYESLMNEFWELGDAVYEKLDAYLPQLEARYVEEWVTELETIVAEEFPDSDYTDAFSDVRAKLTNVTSYDDLEEIERMLIKIEDEVFDGEWNDDYEEYEDESYSLEDELADTRAWMNEMMSTATGSGQELLEDAIASLENITSYDELDELYDDLFSDDLFFEILEAHEDSYIEEITFEELAEWAGYIRSYIAEEGVSLDAPLEAKLLSVERSIETENGNPSDLVDALIDIEYSFFAQ